MMRRLLSAFLASVAASTPLWAQCADVTGPDLPYDTLHLSPGDFRNVRGFNYIAVYTSLNRVGAVVNGALPWKGVASSTVMWENYHPEGTTAKEVHAQLATLKGMGVNAIRVFVSFPCWEFHQRQAEATGQTNVFIKRFADFLARCRRTGIKCIPVIWDNTALGNLHEPTYGSANDYYSTNLFHHWHSSPGVLKLKKLLDAGGGTFVGTDAERFILDLVAASQTTDSVAAWELINEPFGITDPLLGQVIRGTVQILDPASSLPIVLGLPFWDHSMHVHARLPEVDVLSLHHYPIYSTSPALESQVYNATHIRLDPAQTTATPVLAKAILLGECGSPGTGHDYVDAFEQATHVPRPDLGPTETGVGFLSFSAMNGWQRGNYPLNFETGLLYGDCTVRDLNVVQWLRAAAGLPPTTSLTQKSYGTPPPCPQAIPVTTDDPPWAGFVRQAPISSALDSYAERLVWMNATATDFLAVGSIPGCPPDFAAYIELRQMFETAFQSVTAANDLALLWNITAGFVTPPGLPNGNPYASAGTAPPFHVMPATTRGLIDAHIAATQLMLDPNGDFVPTPFTNSILAQSTAGPLFDPRIHAEHLALLCSNVFEPWRVAMRDYVIAQQ
ncbi:MAG: hypothetical protein KDB80_11605 [Planctomycetes bacterium]|nr:hypothetical protein [Planctomycetota bacterium]